MARFIQGDRPEAGVELAMTGWKLARLFLGVALLHATWPRATEQFEAWRSRQSQIDRRLPTAIGHGRDGEKAGRAADSRFDLTINGSFEQGD